MIDIGVNLDHSSYLDNLDTFRDDYHTEGVHGIVCIASNIEEGHKLSSLCEPYEDMHYTLGCHPHHASSWKDEYAEMLIHSFANDAKAIAVGEMGLDFNRNYSTPKEQIHAFEAQLAIAKKSNKPVYLHEREAFNELTQRIEEANLANSGVIHCFTGNTHQLRTYLDLGLYIGITGWLLDERRNQELVEALAYLPLDRLLIETDSPYLLPRNIRPRPKRNHPKFLSYIAKEVAELKGISFEEVKVASEANTKTLFFSVG